MLAPPYPLPHVAIKKICSDAYAVLKINNKFENCGLYYKSFTIVIYDRNDSGQYYKTTITAKAS
jgi:hypothetical protein